MLKYTCCHTQDEQLYSRDKASYERKTSTPPLGPCAVCSEDSSLTSLILFKMEGTVPAMATRMPQPVPVRNLEHGRGGIGGGGGEGRASMCQLPKDYSIWKNHFDELYDQPQITVF